MNSTGCSSSSRCQRLVALEDRPRAGAKRAVVQEDDVGIEQKLPAQREVPPFGGVVIDRSLRARSAHDT